MARSSGKVCVSVRTGHPRREREKFLAVAPRQVRDRTDRSLLPQIVDRETKECRSCESRRRRPCRRARARAAPPGRARPTGAKMIAASSFRRHFIRASCPDRAEPAREFLRTRVARAGEGEHLPSLMPRHLRDDVGRGAEAVNSHAPRFAGLAQTSDSRSSPAHSSGAAPTSSYASGIRKAKPRIGDGVFRVAAVDRVSGEARVRAKILATRCGRIRIRRRSSRATECRRARRLRKPSTPAPISSMRPTISWPIISGSFGIGSSPSTTCRSVRQTPQAVTRTSN